MNSPTQKNLISQLGRDVLLKDLNDLLERAKSGEFSRIPNGKENTTIALRDELAKINSKAIMGKYTS